MKTKIKISKQKIDDIIYNQLEELNADIRSVSSSSEAKAISRTSVQEMVENRHDEKYELKLTAKQIERLADKLEYLEYDLLHIVIRDEVAARFLEYVGKKTFINFSSFYNEIYQPIWYKMMIDELIVEANKRAEEEFENLFKAENYGGRYYTDVSHFQQDYKHLLMKKYAENNNIDIGLNNHSYKTDEERKAYSEVSNIVESYKNYDKDYGRKQWLDKNEWGKMKVYELVSLIKSVKAVA